MTKQKQVIVGAGAVVFHQDAVLLVKRATSPYIHQWTIPGGKIQFGETLKQAAEREIREETGIIIEAGEPIFTFEIIQDRTDQPLHYIVVDLDAHYVSGVPKANDDAAKAAWVSPEEFKKITVNQTTLALLKTKYNFPA